MAVLSAVGLRCLSGVHFRGSYSAVLIFCLSFQFRSTHKGCKLFLLRVGPIFGENTLSREANRNSHYRISPVIRQGFFPFQNNPKNLDSSYKMDLNIWDCLGRVKLVL